MGALVRLLITVLLYLRSILTSTARQTRLNAAHPHLDRLDTAPADGAAAAASPGHQMVAVTPVWTYVSRISTHYLSHQRG